MDDGSGEATQTTTGVTAIFGPTINAFVAPAKGFAMLEGRPLLAFWPLVWILAGLIVCGFFNLDVTRQVARVGMVEQMASSGVEVDPEQMRDRLEILDRFLPVQVTVGNLFILIMVLLIALGLWIGASLLGGSTRFSHAFAVAAMGGLITPLLATVFVTLMWQLDPPEIRRMADFFNGLPSLGLDLLLPARDVSPFWKALLARADVFNVWWMVVTVIGAERLLRLSRGGAVGLSMTLWAVSALSAATWTNLFS